MAFASDKTRQGAAGVSSGGYEIDNSLRFNDDDTAYLSWTPASAGNRKTWTFSVWVKRNNIGDGGVIFGAVGDNARMRWSSDRIQWEFNNTQTWRLTTTQKFRDPSAWFHILINVDTTQGTASNRMSMYINGVKVTAFDNEDYPTLNGEGGVNNNSLQSIGRDATNSDNYFDGYLAEVNFIDGTALTPSSFGESGTYGEWKSIEYTGTYGNNDFYLPFNQDYTVEGFSAVTYTGNDTTQYIGGVGFQPDLTWIKARNSSQNHQIHNAISGASKGLNSNNANAEYTDTNAVTSFDSDGWSMNNSYGSHNSSSYTYVAWNWDMGGSNATNTDGSITSTVRANPTYGQSIVSYTGTLSSDTVGHGLDSAPEMFIIKQRNASDAWITYHTELGAGNYLQLNATNASSGSTQMFDDTEPTASVFSVGGQNDTNGNGDTYIAYCFHSVTGYSKIGSYTGNGSSTGTSVTTGFEPAFLMLKRTDSSASWHMYDNVRKVENTRDLRLLADTSDAEWDSNGGVDVDFNSTGFQLKTSDGAVNASSGTYIYMAFADKREAAFWLDASGNNNDWTPNNLTESDISVDSPTNNFATLNPIMGSTDTHAVVFYEGNLKAWTSGWNGAFATIPMTSGKWYFEYISSGTAVWAGVASLDQDLTADNPQDWSKVLLYGSDGNTRQGASSSSYGSSWVTGDIIGVALDQDSNSLTFYKNNTSQGAIDLTAKNVSTDDLVFGIVGDGVNLFVNFGQDSSFAGEKTAQGNTDTSDNASDFYYTPPTDFLALCTSNLPDPAVIPSEHFNTVLYTGTGITNRAITGVGFQPDLVWAKARNNAQNHTLFNSISGVTKYLNSNTTTAESTNSETLLSFDSDGYTLGNAFTNESAYTYAAWNWKANGSGSLNEVGSIDSTVSANVDAGFSIVKWTGNLTNSTIGHSLNSAPEVLIVKDTGGADSWKVYHTGIASDAETDYIHLNSSDPAGDYHTIWNDTAPTNSVFSVGTSSSSNNTNTMICYAFHSVDGYSKVGSYTGNGQNVPNGVFTYTGFRPAYVMLKRTDSADPWVIFDSAREPENEDDGQDLSLKADSSAAEASYGNIDFLSNGFKVQITSGFMNASGSPYIFLAIAESPFKHSNAR